MSIGKAKVLVKSGLGGSHTEKCVFQLEDGTYEGSDGINCAKNFKAPEGEDEGDEHDEVFYVCKKDKACSEYLYAWHFLRFLIPLHIKLDFENIYHLY